MATTVGGFSAIDDTEVDAESPITETLITRLRDNSYWIDAGTRRTGETSTTKVLTPDGSGGVAWVEANTIAGGLTAKGSSTLASSVTIGIVTGRALYVNVSSADIATGVSEQSSGGFAVIDMDDDTFSGSSCYPSQSSVLMTNSATSGTLTGSAQVIVITAYNTPTTNGVTLYKSGTDYILDKTAGASNTVVTWYVA